MDKQRCFGGMNQLYQRYHDEEWGIPVFDDLRLFEFLILEGAQGGLRWLTILKKRSFYREAFLGFDPCLVSCMTDKDLHSLVRGHNIVANVSKILSVRTNARIFADIQKERGSFANYLWNFVGGSPRVETFACFKDTPRQSNLSQNLSKDLKKRGMVFVGPVMMQSYLQAVGLLSHHGEDCWKRSP